MFITDPLLQDPYIVHGFFGRQGGVSTGDYESLNCGLTSGDDPDAIAENRRRVLDAMGGDVLLTARQQHTATCISVTEPYAERPIADALVTDQPGLVLGVLSADCGPVLFAADGIVGAAHAGWRGALGGVLENTVQAMRDLGAKNIRAVLGPCIHQPSYEVSVGFEEPFLQQSADNKRFFAPHTPDKYLFDVPGYIESRLQEAGVQAISLMGQDTYTQPEHYFSFRRTGHKAGQISVIMLKKY